jgi:hypothetical protein
MWGKNMHEASEMLAAHLAYADQMNALRHSDRRSTGGTSAATTWSFSASTWRTLRHLPRFETAGDPVTRRHY